MTTYRVHLYRPFRTTFDVTAETQEAALRQAYEKPSSEAAEIADAEGIPTDFVVDTLLPSGEIDYLDEWSGELDGDGNPVEDGLDAEETEDAEEESEPLTKTDHYEFSLYLRNCTDNQVRGVWEKEKQANRENYAALAEFEAARRGIVLEG